MLDPRLSDAQFEQTQIPIEYSVGVDDQMPVDFGRIHNFEDIVSRKIVVFNRSKKSRSSLFQLETNSPKSNNPLYMYLTEGHCYRVKNGKEFLNPTFIILATAVMPDPNSAPIHDTAPSATVLFVQNLRKIQSYVRGVTNGVVHFCVCPKTEKNRPDRGSLLVLVVCGRNV